MLHSFFAGEVSVKMKGCFIHNTGCSDNECVDVTPVSDDRKLNFCCCRGSLCNRKFSWQPSMPATTEMSPSKEFLPYSINTLFYMMTNFLPNSCPTGRNECHMGADCVHGVGLLAGCPFRRHIPLS